VKTLLRAPYVATMAGPIVEDAAVLVEDGRIAWVGRRRDLPPPADAHAPELGDAVLLPGLVNTHVHLELTALGQLPPPASFVDWILALRERAMTALAEPAQIAASTERGVRESLRFGVTAVGDITLNPAVTRPVLAASPLRGVSFGEVLGMAGRAAQTEDRIAAATAKAFDREDLREGIEPHAPYSLDLKGYRRCLEEAARRGLPLATHLAETPDESEFLATHTGPFRRLWDALGGWQKGVSSHWGEPIMAMWELGLFRHEPTVLAHVNYASESDLRTLALFRASVAYCPRTHAYFGHPPHRFEEMLAAGINVAAGTDSAASSPDLNLMDDLRLIHRKHPHVPVPTLFAMATIRGARALGMADRFGTIEPGKSADFCVFKVSSRDPLRELLETDVLPDQVWIGGERVYAAAPVP
jgi:cytosine/adenosine deaminase-related metal-dependent hydrolase